MSALLSIKSSNFGQIVSRHGLALLVGVVVALVAGMPQVVARHTIGEAYRGVPYLINDSEGEYLSRVQEVLDGHLSVASPTLYEYKNSVALIPPYSEILFYALPKVVLGISLEATIFMSKFILPALLYIFIYLFALACLNRNDIPAQVAAISAGLLVVLGYDAYDYRNFLASVLHGTHDPAGLLWNRLVNPIAGGILLFAYLWRLAIAYMYERGWKNYIVAGILLALTPGYFFSFALGTVITAMICCALLIKRKYRVAAKMCFVQALAVLINAPYLSSALLATHTGAKYGDALKSGMLLTHTPLINLISLATLSGVILGWIVSRHVRPRDNHEPWWDIVLAVAVGSFAIYNQQILTGRAIWPQHFVQYTSPLSMVLVVVLLHNILRDYSPRIWRTCSIILILIAALFGWRGFQSASVAVIPKFTELQRFAGVIQFLRTHAEKDCVVYVAPAYPSEINRFIPALTSCNDYHSFYIYNGIPGERVLHNYLVNLRFRGISVQNVKSHFYADPFLTTSYFFRDWNDILCNNLTGCFDKWQMKFSKRDEIDRWFAATEHEVESAYTVFSANDFYSELMKYRLDYVVVDTTTPLEIQERKYSFLKPMGIIDGFAIYAVMQRPL